MVFSSFAWLVPALPLGGVLANFLLFRRNRAVAPMVALFAVCAALALSLGLAAQVLLAPAPRVDSIKWIEVSSQVFGHFTVSVGTLLDPLSAMMLVVVTLVSSLVHLYSLGYMHDEPGIARYFIYLNLFTFSMLGLVLSPNLYQAYLFWELVGLCSYLLIGFYITKPEANQACKKAFVVNRVGDLGLFIGILFLAYYLGTVDFLELPSRLGQWPLFSPAWLPLGAVALLLFCGAVGKSAQFPLHVWLPDAMEGPTPVSALIHAATMVVAGVFLVARAWVVFDASLLSSVDAARVVAWIGGFTSLFAATIALTQTDIKRVLAYSTISQLGYMMMALGVGGLGVTAGTFHLFTHAFFKALLFLGAGSVIHAVHSNDLGQMGGLLKRMPVTGWTFLAGCLAIAGVPPFAGFFSKDEILLALEQAGQARLYWLALAVAFLTAFYMFRLFFLAFTGSESARSQGQAHESPATMTVPLVVLAVLSLLGGLVSLPEGRSFGDYIHYARPAALEADWQKAAGLASANPTARGDYRLASAVWAAAPPAPASSAPEAAAESHAFRLHWDVALPATLAGLLGILLASLFYFFHAFNAGKVAGALGPLYRLVYNKYYVDEAYRWMLDHVYYVLSSGLAWFDRHVVDGFMNGLAWASQAGGGVIRRAQTGRVQAYVLGMVGGILAILGVLGLLNP